MSESPRNSSPSPEVARTTTAEVLRNDLRNDSVGEKNDMSQRGLSTAKNLLAQIDGTNPPIIVAANDANSQVTDSTAGAKSVDTKVQADLSLLKRLDELTAKNYETPAQASAAERSITEPSISERKKPPSVAERIAPPVQQEVKQPQVASPEQNATSAPPQQAAYRRQLSPEDQKQLISELQRDYNKPSTNDKSKGNEKLKANEKMPKRIDATTAEQARKAQEKAKELGVPLVAHFGATWCGPCQAMDRNVYNKMENPQSGVKAVFLHVDVDKAANGGRDIAKTLGIGLGTSVPQVAVFDASGKKTYNSGGGLSYAGLKDIIDRARK